MATRYLDWPEGPNPKAPTVNANPRDFPYVRTEPRASLRPVDPSTGGYRAPVQPTAPAPVASAPAPSAAAAPTNAAKPGLLGRAAAGVRSAGATAAGKVGSALISPVSLALAAPTLYAQKEEDRPLVEVGTVKDGSFMGDLAKRFEKTGLVKMREPGKAPYEPSPSAPASTPAGRGLETLRRTGVQQNTTTTAGGGWGSVNPPNAKVGSPFDRTADVRSAIDTGVIPESLQDGRIWRSGNSYVGKNVGPGASIADARTGMNRTGGGTLSVMDTSAGFAADQAAAARYDARMAAERAFDPSSQNRTVMSGRTHGVLGNSDWNTRLSEQRMFEKGANETGRNYRARMAAMADRANNGDNNSTTRRGQDFGERSDLRRDGTTRRGQDMDLQGRLLPKQMEMELAARMRGLRADAYNASGGDYTKMANYLASVGLDPSDALKLASDTRGLTDKNRAASDKQFEHRAVTTDKDGNLVINNAMAAVSRNVREQLAPGYDGMTPEQQGSYRPVLDAGQNIVEGMNKLREDTLWKKFGVDGAPALTTLPDLRGATSEDVGWWEGATTPDVQRGDRKITLRDGTARYVPKAMFNENERALLRDMK